MLLKRNIDIQKRAILWSIIIIISELGEGF